jgi:Glu-tRNA(Gln) amidotransferase subunit E-like FAD-binding protein
MNQQKKNINTVYMKNGLFCLLLLISIYSVHRFSRDVFERTKNKYLDHIKNVQKDLHETRQLLEKDTELKLNQESAYQQLIDERRQLLTRYHTSTVDRNVSAHTPSSIVDDVRTHPHLISNITFHRQVF